MAQAWTGVPKAAAPPSLRWSVHRQRRYHLHMPRQNRFQHQQYPTTPAIKPTLVRARASTQPSLKPARLHEVHGIHHVLLVHGTFLGDDPFGISAILRSVADNIGRFGSHLNSLADKLAEVTESVTTAVAKDVGNYSEDFRARFASLTGEGIQVQELSPGWSGQNDHVARADLAIRLLVRLSELIEQPDQRVLLWGHSHAGNGFALLSNLLANDRESVARFFEAAGAQGSHWERARELLAAARSPHPLGESVDIVTFGTPVRYGWDSTGYRKLVHVLHHREPDAAAPFRTRPLFPPHFVKDTLTARYGDWVQAFAIAGTDVPAVTSAAAHTALDRLLTANLTPPKHGVDTKYIVPPRVRDACARWKTGTRCHSDGVNLLLDYEPCGRRTRIGQPIEQAILGHGVATTLDWLPAHLDLVVQALDDRF